MKEIKLMNLTLKNFKGIKDFAIDVNGNDASIFGDNATGKTTLYDAFLWLLFNKDSQNRTKFSIKTITPDGKEMNNMENEVEATFIVDGVELTLKKVHFENWARAKNAPEATFKGNRNKYFINDVPTPEGQYNTAIKGLIDEDVFKLLTSPTYFNEQLKWESRRKTLLEITGDLSDEEVISANKKLQELTGVLKGRKIEDHKKIIDARKRKINDELKSIPISIKENRLSLPAEEIDVPSIEKEVAVIEKELSKNETQINSIKNGSAVVGKQQELQQVELDLKTIQNELESGSIEQAAKINAKIQEEQSNIAILKRKKEDAEHQVKRNKSDIETIDAELVRLREDWTTRNELTHTHDSEDECPTCKQSLPVDEVKAAKEKASAAFNLTKSTELERLNALGKSKGAKKAELIDYNEKQTAVIDGIQSQITEKEKAVSKLTTEVETLRTGIVEARQSKRYTDKVQERVEIEKSIVTLQENGQSAVSDIEKVVVELRAKLRERNAKIAQQDTAVATRARILELETQQVELAKQFEQVEKELFLIEEFTRTKVDLLDEKINSKFKLARFKLFHTQVDGTLNDVCETTFDGVPYGSGLNNAAKVNVGLDIIQTLSDHYKFRVPIFVDNAEAVVELAKTDAQVISLIVSGKDKQLRIEKQSEKEDYLSAGEELLASAREAI